MRICIIGKFPPIQGGVSARTYWTAHALARRGHDVHVVTNAKESRPPFRMHMRREDWDRCEADYGTGRVVMHWTEPVDRSQFHIPLASPFVSKLAAVAARAHASTPFDVVLSYYMEPYGVAGHLAAEIIGRPHVVRMAGSDAGRLWHHEQFEALYDHVLRAAAAVLIVGKVAERAVERGIDPARIAFGGGFPVPNNVFTPDGPLLDLPELAAEIVKDRSLNELMWGNFIGDRPYLGIYGKIGPTKGSFALLDAMHRLKQTGRDVGLVALSHGRPLVERRFRERVQELGLMDNVLQIPFLPHWQVPKFLRTCLAVCCLEQDFPIVFHAPIVAREVLHCGICLVGSTEVIAKLPADRPLVDGYNCVAISDVNDIDVLSARLAEIVDDPNAASAIGTRGRDYIIDVEAGADFPATLEKILQTAAVMRPCPC